MTSERQKNAGFPLPDAVTGHDLVCVQMMIPDHPRYREAFRGHIDQLARWWTWEKSYDAGDTRASEAAEYWRYLIYHYFEWGCPGDINMFDIKQDPTDPCRLLKSTDGGVTWTAAFNYALCSSGSGSSWEIGFKMFVDNYEVYEQTLQQYLDSTTYMPAAVTNAAQADLDAALCHACRIIVDQLCQIELERRDREQAPKTFLGAAVLAFGGFLVSLFTGNPAVMVAAAVALAQVIAAGYELFTALNDAALQDEYAKNKVACCMYDNLKGSPIARADLETSLDGCGLIANAEDLRVAVSGLLTEDKFQMAFFEILARAVRESELGLIVEDCACDDTWCVTWDLKTDPGGWSGFAPYTAEHRPGIGMVGIRASDPDQTYITLQFGATVNVTSIEFTWEEVAAPNANSFVIDGEYGSIALPRLRWETDGPYATFGWTGDENLTGVSVGCERAGGTDTGSNAITSVTMTGTGTPPPGGTPC